ncbi:low-density lipoprotein receptor-related protein 3 [Trichonephila clavipes]|uniref:Low-density lipoprotein receptor-related protein 3 n=1 Tax=Trichonephila clavipes TaxID=2585209 RepID=A0A8X6WB59_TRICX|nr:low-density lipoprotein receptor-related protein 3 [Trichonephila clavipes]
MFILFYLSNARAWLLDHLPPRLPILTDDVISRVFMESRALEQVVAIYSSMAAEWAGLVSNHDKSVEVQNDEALFWLNDYVNKQNCRIWSEANPQVYVETPLHPEKLTVWCALWAGGILLQKR